MSVGLETATLVPICVESILYGHFLFLFLFSSFIVWSRDCQSPNTRRINVKLFLVSLSMFVVGTVHLGTALHRVLHAFVPSKNQSSPLDTLKTINTACYISKTVAYAVQIVLGDGFMIYRLYMVWNWNKLVCLPVALTLLGGIAASAGSIHHSAMSSLGNSTPLFEAQEKAWVLSSMSLAFFTNAYSTALIAGRMWWVPHKIYGNSSHSGGNQCNFGPTAVIIIESGVVYSSCMIILIALYATRSYTQNIVLDALTQIIGIVFSLIIVRVALGVSGAKPIKRASTTFSLNKASSTFGLGIMSRIRWPGTTSAGSNGSTAPSATSTDHWHRSGAHCGSLSADMFHAAKSGPQGMHGFISVSVTKSNDANYTTQGSTVTMSDEEEANGIDQMEGGPSK